MVDTSPRTDEPSAAGSSVKRRSADGLENSEQAGVAFGVESSDVESVEELRDELVGGGLVGGADVQDERVELRLVGDVDLDGRAR